MICNIKSFDILTLSKDVSSLTFHESYIICLYSDPFKNIMALTPCHFSNEHFHYYLHPDYNPATTRFNILPNIDHSKCNNSSYAHLYSYEVLVPTDTLHDLCLISYTKRGFNFASDYYQYLLLFNAL